MFQWSKLEVTWNASGRESMSSRTMVNSLLEDAELIGLLPRILQHCMHCDKRFFRTWATSSEPDKVPGGARIHLRHQGDLVPSLVGIVLVDTDRINPQDAVFGKIAEPAENLVSVRGNSKDTPVYENNPLFDAVAPDVGNGLELWSRI